MIKSDRVVRISMKCPCCKRRAFDISAATKILKSQIRIEMKCPQCRNIVTVNCAGKTA